MADESGRTTRRFWLGKYMDREGEVEVHVELECPAGFTEEDRQRVETALRNGLHFQIVPRYVVEPYSIEEDELEALRRLGL